MAGNTERISLPLNQDPTSKFYIHPSDANSAQLVSFKFKAKNKLGFVTGAIPKTNSESDPEQYVAWERCNDLVMSWILVNLDPVIAKSVLFFKSAEDVWKDLEERFGFASMAQVFSLEQKLAQISQGTQSVSEFYTEIKTLWDIISDAHPIPYCTCNKCTCNLTQKIFQREQEKNLLQFMMKLAEQFSTIRGNILMMSPLPKVSEAYRIFSQEERHKELTQQTTQTESLAFVAGRRNTDHQTRNYRSTGNNHFQKQGIAGNNNYSNSNFRQQSGFTGFKDRKVAAVGFGDAADIPDNQQRISTESLSAEEYKAFLNFIGKNNDTEKVDTNHTALMTDFKLINNPNFTITVPDGRKVIVKYIGSVRLNNNIVLHNVLHVLEFKFNLISVHKLCKDMNCRVYFTHSECFIQGHTQGETSMLLAKFWGDCVICAAYLINIMPLQAIQNEIPYEKLFKKPVSLEHMRVFGCLCYVNTSKVHRGKLDPRAASGVFLGYSVSKKGYKDDYTTHLEQFLSSQVQSDDSLPATPLLSFSHSSNSSTQSSDSSSHTHISDNNLSFTLVSSPIPYSDPIHDQQPPRQTSRPHKKPFWHNDYVCNTSISDHWCNLVSYTDSSPHLALLSHITHVQEPSSYSEAVSDRHWVEEMEKEIAALQKNDTWDLSLFIKKVGDHITLAAVYVDDIIITGSDQDTIELFKQHLDAKFSIKDLGLLTFFLGIKVGYVAEGIVLSELKFVKELLADLPFDLSRKDTTPLPQHLKLSADLGVPISDPELYRSLVGKLNYLTNTRYDLLHSVNGRKGPGEYWAKRVNGQSIPEAIKEIYKYEIPKC
uniref:Reverse transcriptase Ty1/copia-type domain-containing protein n=1 Tax=Chenopodium quinoa TaxID=63459 RepID=A0A803LAE5_CHEQI